MSVEEKEEKTEEEKKEPTEDVFVAPEEIPSEKPIEEEERPAEKKPWWKFW